MIAKKKLRICAVLLAIVLVISVMPVNYVSAAGTSKSSAVVAEMENAEVLQGSSVAQAFTETSFPVSGGGYAGCISNGTAVPYEIRVTFTVSGTDSYDIWLDSFLGNVGYLSTFKWKMDEGTYQDYAPIGDPIKAGYTCGIWGLETDMYWAKLAVENLEAGTHTLSILVDQLRSDNDWQIAVFDVLMLAPTDWNWTPDGINPPEAPAEPGNGSVVAEMEDAEILQGSSVAQVFTETSFPVSGGGYAGCIANGTAVPYEIRVTFTVDSTDSYDIWLDSFLGNVGYLSTFKWKLDDGTYQDYAPIGDPIKAGYTCGIWGLETDMYWAKLAVENLAAGTHTLSILVEQLRSDNDWQIAVFDVLMLAPTDWNWTPNGINPPEPPAEPGNGSVVVEMENAEILQGSSVAQVFTETSFPVSGGGYAGCITNGTAVPYEIRVTFSVSNTDSYDIWLDSFLGNVGYLSTFKWKLDDGTYQDYAPIGDPIKAGYTCGLWGLETDMYWAKLAVENLAAGTHTLSILVDQLRSDNDWQIAVFDVLMLAPTDWDWTPNGINPPEPPAEPSSRAVVAEMEDAEILQGEGGVAQVFKETSFPVSGGGYAGCISNGTAAPYEIRVTFTVSSTDSYDIWLDSFLGNVDYLSRFKWKLDDGDYQDYAPIGGTIKAGYTCGIWGVETDMYWAKLAVENLEAGTHTLSIYVDQMRSGNDWQIAVFDVLMLAPTDWNWTPDGINPPEPSEEPPVVPDNGSVVVEMETSEVLQGSGIAQVFTQTDYQVSGGGYVGCLSDKAEPYEIRVTFTVSNPGQYDIWLDSFLGNVGYVSNFKWKLDDGAYQGFLPIGNTIDAGYPCGIWGLITNMYWAKLAVEYLDAGTHTLSIYVDQLRSSENDWQIAVFDVLMLAPTEWNWTPNGISRPFDAATMKFAFVGGQVNTQRADQDTSFTVDVTNQCLELVPADANFVLQLRYKGQKVLNVNYEPAVPTSQWNVGENYTTTVTMKVPFNVPDGEYEIWSGILNMNYADGEAFKKIGDLQVGDPVVLPEPMTVDISDLSVPAQIARGTAFEVSANVKVNKDAGNARAYLAFYQGEELWYVAELGQVADILKAGVSTQITASAVVDEDVPDGSYTIQLGIHWYESNGGQGSVVLQGGTFAGERTYKPLSYGKYKPQKTGSCQLWYVNQNHAMIWNGEPYIPVGGMVCSNYLIWYDVNNPDANKDRWEQEKQMLQELKDNNIKHIYLNINQTIDSYPAGVLETYFDLLEEYGMTYGLQIGAPMSLRTSEYYAIRAAKAQITASVTASGVVEVAGDVNMAFLGSSSILDSSCKYIVVDNTTGAAVASGDGTAKVGEDGKIHYRAEVNGISDGNYTVYFTPWVRVKETQYVDPYLCADALEQKYKDFASSFMAGDNFRSFIDVLCNESGYVNSVEPARLTGDAHQAAYRQWLQDRYVTVDALNEAWKLMKPVDSFETAANLLPVYTNENGISFNMDLTNNQIYCVDVNNSLLWDDYIRFREDSARNMNNDAADWITSSGNTDVPVVYKHISILQDNNVNNRTVGGFDGLGGEIYGNLEKTPATRTYAFAEAEQSAKTIWFIITETNTDEDVFAKYHSGQENWGYSSEEYMHEFFQAHLDGGAKGIYDFVVFGNSFTELNAYSYHNKPIQYLWNQHFREKVEANADEIANTLRVAEKTYYLYPATQSWWTLANRREAAIYDDDYAETRIFRMNGDLVLQTFNPAVDKDALFVNLEDAPATLNWGPALNNYLAEKPDDEKVVYMGLRKDLGSIPVIDAYFTDEIVDNGNGEQIQVLKPTDTSEILAQTSDGKVWALRDGDLYIIANTGWNGGEAPPDGQYHYVNYLDLIDFDAEDKPDPDPDPNPDPDPTEPVNPVKPSTKPQEPAGDELPFKDISKTAWYYDAVKFVADRGLMNGVSATEFGPEGQVTRAMLVTILYRYEGEPDVSGKTAFTDVKDGAYYADAVKWAADNGIVNGTSQTTFDPDSPVTREQMVTILYRYATFKGVDVTGQANLHAYADADQISTFAEQAFAWAVNAGVTKGDGVRLNPHGTAKRCEVAQLLMNYIQNVIEK